MTAHTPSDVLQHYARTLELAAPEEWRAFVQCFDAYATAVTVAVTRADSSEILVAQGRARCMLHLLDLFMHTAPKPQPAPQTPPQP